MSRLEILPLDLLRVEALEAFIAWLLAYVPRPITRKIMLCEWCEYTGYPLTAELVARVYHE